MSHYGAFALPLLHELHRHRRRARAPLGSRRGWRSSATRLLVVGDETMLKIHVHTDTPERARAVRASTATSSTRRSPTCTADRRPRRAARRRRDSPRVVVAVASGDGMRGAVRGRGRPVVDGGLTLNPSTNELLDGIRRLPGAEEIIVLPNSPNVILAAEEAARAGRAPVRVVASTSLQAGAGGAGRARLLGRRRRGNATGWSAELARCAPTAWSPPPPATTPTAASAAATRSASSARRSSPGAAPDRPWPRSIERLAEGAEIVTVLEGADAPIALDRARARRSDGAELEIHDGGQPNYWWLIAAQ